MFFPIEWAKLSRKNGTVPEMAKKMCCLPLKAKHPLILIKQNRSNPQTMNGACNHYPPLPLSVFVLP
jgi:hypothetical protein